MNEPIRRGDGVTTLLFLLDLKRKADPIELLGELEARWGGPGSIAAAEYIPFHSEAEG